MQKYDSPEDYLVGQLAGFVAKCPLPDKPTGPAAADLQQVQSLFWNPPFSTLCPSLVHSECDETNQAQDNQQNEVTGHPNRNRGEHGRHGFRFVFVMGRSIRTVRESIVVAEVAETLGLSASTSKVSATSATVM